MSEYKSEKPYTISYRSALQNFTMAFKDLHKAILKANELKRPVYDENGKLVYEPELVVYYKGEWENSEF